MSALNISLQETGNETAGSSTFSKALLLNTVFSGPESAVPPPQCLRMLPAQSVSTWRVRVPTMIPSALSGPSKLKES